MEYIEVESAGLKLSRLALGTMTIGDQVGEAGAIQMLEACVAAGVNFVDTANVYNGGESEVVLGKILDRFGDHFAVSSKVGGSPNPDAPDARPLSREGLRKGVEGSLRRLGRDRLDVLFMHHPDPSTPSLDTAEEVDALIREGKVASWGVSNYAAWQISELRWLCRTNGLTEPVIAQPVYNLLARRLELEYSEYSVSSGLLNYVYNPLAGGLLTGKHRAGQASEDGRFGAGNRGKMYRDRYWNEPVLEAVDQLTRIAEGAGLTIIELALRWLLGRPAVSGILLGASRPDQLTSNLAAASGPALPGDVLDECDSVWSALEGVAPTYVR